MWFYWQPQTEFCLYKVNEKGRDWTSDWGFRLVIYISRLISIWSSCLMPPECNWHPRSKGSSWHQRAWSTEAAGQGRNRAHRPGAGSSVVIISSGLTQPLVRPGLRNFDRSVKYHRLILSKLYIFLTIKRD